MDSSVAPTREVGPPRSSLPAPPAAPRRVRIRNRALSLLTLAVCAAVLVFDRSPLGILAIVFILVVPFERWFPRHRQPFRRRLLGMDVGYALMQPLITFLGLGLAVVIGAISLAWLPGLAVRPLVMLLPGPLQLVLGVVLFDLAIYWVHRWNHEVPFLWRFHMIHHSTEHLDWVSGFRNHPFDGAIVGPPFFFLLGAGFSTEFSGALAVIQIVTGLFLHANVNWRLRPLHRLIITPEFHHWHHANEPDAINTNYSVFLPLSDQLFGTYFMPPDRRPQVYGVNAEVPSSIFGQLRQPFRGTQSPFWFLRHPIAGARHGWARTKSGLRQVWRSSRRRTRTGTDAIRLRGGQLAAPSQSPPQRTSR